jgi:NAD(P) transhydrogenase
MTFDLIVIGSGPGGQRAATQGAKAGKKVAIIEELPALGGGCVHYGTLPSKSFRESVYRWSLGSRGTLGNESEDSKQVSKKINDLPSMQLLLRRRNRVVSEEARIVHDQLKRNGVTIYHGRATLLSSTEVEIKSKSDASPEKISAPIIILAVGARPVAPKPLAVDGERVHDSDTVLDQKVLPKRLVVLGAGIIGCEYASMFSMAGSKVYLVDRRHEILASVDREIVNHLVERFVAQGVEIILEAEASEIVYNSDRTGITVCLTNGKPVLEADVVLVALGRVGNTENMGLESVGVERDDRGLIKVDRFYRTSLPNIYAVGDVVGQPALASTSMEQGRIACTHALGLGQNEMPRFFPYGIYSIPEISMIGETEEALVAQNKPFVVGRARYRELARGQIVGDRWGLLKLMVEPDTQKILGVHIVGDNAAELIHIGQAVMTLGGDLQYFVDNVFNYPTLAEAYKTAAFQAMNLLRLAKAAEKITTQTV